MAPEACPVATGVPLTAIVAPGSAAVGVTLTWATVTEAV
jgi:hypothetical protein